MVVMMVVVVAEVVVAMQGDMGHRRLGHRRLGALVELSAMDVPVWVSSQNHPDNQTLLSGMC